MKVNMPIDGGKNSFSGWNNISMKMMEHDDLDKFMTILNKNRPSVLQVMQEEIADDETNFFIVENRKLRELLMKCKLWMEDNEPISVMDEPLSKDQSHFYDSLIKEIDEHFNA